MASKMGGARKELPVNYSGIEYTVLQTACPSGRVWTVTFVNGKTKFAVSHSRSIAIRMAEIAVDSSLAAKRRNVNNAPGERPGHYLGDGTSSPSRIRKGR
jgi:hypothetical protein